MGLSETHLIRPDGWGVKGHYSSAHDLAVFTMYAIKYPMFVDLISTPSYTTSDGSYTVSNTNKMLNTYPGIVGGKTGYDDDAGYCLIEVAQRDGSTMISVTLDGVAPDDWYDDNRVLLDYAFEQKADEIAKKTGVTGEVVSYRDPDAVNVLAMATPGASIGLPKPTASPTVATPVSAASANQLPTAEAVAATGESGGSGGVSGKLLVAVIVTGIVIVAGIFGSVATSSSHKRLSKGD
jgi:D-alanyl-D-alanine carboxypeptidase (penicillin-binding protein 5/6)